MTASTMNEVTIPRQSNGPWQWWRRLRERKRTIDYDALAQFVESQRAELTLAGDVDAVAGSAAKAVAKQAVEKLDEAASKRLPLEGRWNCAYHAERLILSLLAPERQKIELLRRLNECQRIQAPFTSFYEAQITSGETDGDGEDRFDMLVMLVGDLQRYISNKHLKMRYARYAVYRVGVVFCISLVLFLSVVSLHHWV